MIVTPSEVQAQVDRAREAEADAAPRFLVERRSQDLLLRGLREAREAGREGQLVALEKEHLRVEVDPQRHDVGEVIVAAERDAHVPSVEVDAGGRLPADRGRGPGAERSVEGVPAAEDDVRIDSVDPGVEAEVAVE